MADQIWDIGELIEAATDPSPKGASRRVVLGNRRWDREVSMNRLKRLLLFAGTVLITVLILVIFLSWLEKM